MFQYFYSVLKRRGARIGVSFSILKTEICHWHTLRDGDSPLRSLVSLDGTLFHPYPSVRWLGYWFTPSMDTSTYFQKRLALAQGAFSIVTQLSPPGMGLAPHMNRSLATGLILPILTYGVDLFTPNASSLVKMTVLWNKVLRWTTNCFYSTPISILPCDGCFPPLDSFLSHKRKMAAFRMEYSSPLINPAAARMPTTFPGHSQKRATDSLRARLGGLKWNYIQLRWD